MTARYDGECRLPDCGDRAIVAGQTIIMKRDGQWNHKTCPALAPVGLLARRLVAREPEQAGRHQRRERDEHGVEPVQVERAQEEGPVPGGEPNDDVRPG